MSQGQAIRKAALVVSLMEPGARSRLLESLPVDVGTEMKKALSFIAQEKWNRREIVELALGDEFHQVESRHEIGMEQLLQLAKCMDSAGFSRVLVASQLRNPDFLVSMLDPGYAADVQRHWQLMPAMPEQLRLATIASSIKFLENSRERG
jgi:hypothetical protein